MWGSNPVFLCNFLLGDIEVGASLPSEVAGLYMGGVKLLSLHNWSLAADPG